MLRAIETRYFGPTNFNGSRVKAIGRRREGDMPALSLTDAWDYGHGVEDNHARVAKLLAAQLDWSGLYIGGSTDAGYCFVNSGLSPHDLSEAEFRLSLGVRDRDWFYVAPRER